MPEIKKIGAVILNPEKDKMIVVRKKGKSTFIIPGGRPEAGESDLEALARELLEELQVNLVESNFFGEFHEPAEFNEGQLTMRVYDVQVTGVPAVDNEIVEAIWIDSKYQVDGISLGSTLRNHVVPELVRRGNL